MVETISPTDAQIELAAHKWAYNANREYAIGDIVYFRQNWRSLPGLRVYVESEVEHQCERCCGSGEIITDWDLYLRMDRDGALADAGTAECPNCDGSGRIVL